MSEIISIPFEFADYKYTALVNIKKQSFNRFFIITIMDGQLEQLLFGNHIFIETEDGVVPESRLAGDTAAMKLQEAVLKSLNKYFLSETPPQTY